MDVNQTLADEQIAMMRAAATDDPAERASQQDIAGRHGGYLVSRGYPHNPYPAPVA